MGISVRKFLGWEPAEITTYEYDGVGRLTSAITVRESEFSHLDRAWLLDSWKKANEPRGSHGHLMSEATDRANWGKYTVGKPSTDYAAKALFDAKEEWKKEAGEYAGMEYSVFRVEKKD